MLFTTIKQKKIRRKAKQKQGDTESFKKTTFAFERVKVMKNLNTPLRFLFAGGGTGGHLYPAIAVADEIKRLKPESEIVFVGTKSKIEGRVIPKLGYGFRVNLDKGICKKI